jgi:NADH:ubiquinone oxidoreductase subunit 3 (subunit A)
VANIITSLPFVLFISLVIALVIYWIGGRIAPKGAKTKGKLAPYACGEDFPAEKLQLNVESFFVYAVYFMIFDILAFILATSFMNPGIIPAFYAIVTLLAVVVLLPLLKLR